MPRSPPRSELPRSSWTTGETFKILSRSRVERPADTRTELAPKGAKCLEALEMENGVGDGFRTRDFRSHTRKR